MAARLRRIAPGVLGLAAVALAVLAVSCGQDSDAAVPAGPTPAAGPTSTPPPTASPAERYQRIACQFDVPTNRYVECGYLTVPESRDGPTERFIRLAVVVVKADAARPKADPIVYLDGGPGGSTLEIAFRVFDGWFGYFAQDRDVVLFDQRGIGKSEPALDCPQFNNALRQAVEENISREELSALSVTALTDCHNRLAQQGYDLSAYNSAESAADVAELRRALGYEEWNLYGISYGTRLALTVLRDHPEGVRSVILDSAYPPEVDLYAELIPNAQRAFEALFDGCAADSACASAYPELETVFFGLVDQLNEEPAQLQVENVGTGVVIQAQMNGDLLLASMFQALYDAGSIPYLPAVVYDASEGNLDTLTPLLGDLFFTYDTISAGMHYSVQCVEEVPFGSAEAYEDAAAAHPAIRHAFDLEPILDICAKWDVQPADEKENRPITSDIPTLVLAGDYDPITPPAWGQQVAQGLSRGHFLQFPGIGHGASVSDICPFEITIAFLESPTAAPDQSCIASMGGPPFFTELP